MMRLKLTILRSVHDDVAHVLVGEVVVGHHLAAVERAPVGPDPAGFDLVVWIWFKQ